MCLCSESLSFLTEMSSGSGFIYFVRMAEVFWCNYKSYWKKKALLLSLELVVTNPAEFMELLP